MRRSPSSLPTRPSSPPRRARSTWRWARRCANTPARPTARSCCRCCCRCNAPPRPATGSGPCSMRANFTIRCAGRRARPPLACQRARPGTCRGRRAHAAVMARQPSPATAGDRHRRRAQAIGAWARRRAGLPHGRDAGRRDADAKEIAALFVRHRLTGAAARPMGRDRSGAPRRSIRQFREAEQLAEREGLSFAAAMRMLAGAAVDNAVSDVAVADWSRVTAGPWLAYVCCARPTVPVPIQSPAACAPRCARIRRGCAGCSTCARTAPAASLPTTWGWARRCRRWRSWREKQAGRLGAGADCGADQRGRQLAAELGRFAPHLRVQLVRGADRRFQWAQTKRATSR